MLYIQFIMGTSLYRIDLNLSNLDDNNIFWASIAHAPFGFGMLA